MLFTEKENKTPTVECEDYVPRMMKTALSPFLIRTQKIHSQAGLSGMMTLLVWMEKMMNNKMTMAMMKNMMMMKMMMKMTR